MVSTEQRARQALRGPPDKGALSPRGEKERGLAGSGSQLGKVDFLGFSRGFSSS